MTTMNMYQKTLEGMIENAKQSNNGEVPNWLKVAQQIFVFGVKIVASFDLDKSKKFSDIFNGAGLMDIVNKTDDEAKNEDMFLI